MIRLIFLLLAFCQAAAAQQLVSSYQGTLTLSAATSTTLIAANVTMAPNSATLPATFNGDTLTVINTVSVNTMYVCWGGGTASATSGCEPILPGAGDTVTLKGTGSPPSMFSTSGTTVAFRQGQ